MGNGIRNQPGDANVLDYRSASSARVQRVLAELSKSEKVGAAKLATKLLIGIPLTLIAPAFVALFACAIMYRHGRHMPSIVLMFIGVTAVVVPLLMLFERLSNGQFFANRVSEYDVPGPWMAWIGYVEFALTGPRLLWEVFDALRGGVGPMDQQLRVVAAEIVVEMLDAGEGKTIRALVRADRPRTDVERATNYLVKRDWAGISSRRDRVWLASSARERLGRL